MARPTSFRLFKIKNYLSPCQNFSDTRLSSSIVPARFLRGSRYSKDDNQEEMKFQRLLRSLRNEIPKQSNSEVTLSTESAPESLQESAPESLQESAPESLHVIETNILDASNTITSEDLIKKLEDKFTPLQGLLYTRQLERKYKKSLGVLRSLGERLQALKVPIAMGSDKLPCPVEIVLPSPVMESYRNKDEFNIGLGLDGNEKTVGFFLDTPSEFSTTFCISVKELSTVKENHKKLAEDFEIYVRSSSLSASQHFADGGYWKKLVVRSNSDGDTMGIIVMHPQNLSQEELQAEKEKLKEYFLNLPKDNYNLHSLYFQSCTQSRCTHEQSPFELLLGEPTIIEEINNIKVHISPDSFFHLNPKAAEAMHNSILKLCRVKNSTTILDIQCGPGPVSLLFAPRVKKCIGIDDSTQAISNAKINSLENGLYNVEFLCGRTEHVVKDVLGNDYHEDVIAVLNTSRAGINKSVITTLREFKNMKKIIYMTTKPQAALDNFVHLCRPGGSSKNIGKAFLPILAVPVDLFPQTDQYALIVMFQRI